MFNTTLARDQRKLQPPPASRTEPLYAVNKILAKEMRCGKPYYYIHWKNYPSDDDSWEPEENLTPDLVEAIINSCWARSGYCSLLAFNYELTLIRIPDQKYHVTRVADSSFSSGNQSGNQSGRTAADQSATPVSSTAVRG